MDGAPTPETGERLPMGVLAPFITVSREAINAAPSANAAIAAYLASVCHHLHWVAGIFYVVDPASPRMLTPTCEVHQRDVPRLGAVPVIAARPPADDFLGLGGRVLDTGKPAWVTDVSRDPNFKAREYAELLSLKGALAVPVYLGERLGAMAEFFASNTVTPTAEMLDAIQIATKVLGNRLAMLPSPA